MRYINLLTYLLYTSAFTGANITSFLKCELLEWCREYAAAE